MSSASTKAKSASLQYRSVLRVYIPAENLAGRVEGIVTPIDEHTCRLEMGSDSYALVAWVVSMLDVEFEVQMTMFPLGTDTSFTVIVACARLAEPQWICGSTAVTNDGNCSAEMAFSKRVIVFSHAYYPSRPELDAGRNGQVRHDE